MAEIKKLVTTEIRQAWTSLGKGQNQKRKRYYRATPNGTFVKDEF
jgi:hypothetical protein